MSFDCLNVCIVMHCPWTVSGTKRSFGKSTAALERTSFQSGGEANRLINVVDVEGLEIREATRTAFGPGWGHCAWGQCKTGLSRGQSAKGYGDD